MKDPKIPPSMTIDGKPLRFCDVIRAREIVRKMSEMADIPFQAEPLWVATPEEHAELCNIFNVRKG